LNTILKISNLSTGYSKYKTVTAKPFSVNVGYGQLIGIIGKNGSGKTTLLKTLCNLIKPISGSVEIENVNITSIPAIERAKKISYIMPNTGFIPDIPVSDVVAMGRFAGTGWLNAQDNNDKMLCCEAIAKSEISHLTEKKFHSLSDGEKQRVLFAMALAQNTQLMLFDEPSAFLDFPARNHIYRIMYNLTRSENKTIIFSTHDIRRALEICDTIWAFNGDTIESGIPEFVGINNVYDNIFKDEKLNFDIEKLDFIPADLNNNIPVEINGSGRLYAWTLHILKRIGFSPQCNIKASFSVIVNETDKTWTINSGKEIFTTSSCTEFEEKMKSLIKKQTL